MKILARLGDIISSRINAVLGRSENPEKFIRLMIKKIEGTLAGLRASCAEVMAESKKPCAR